MEREKDWYFTFGCGQEHTTMRFVIDRRVSHKLLKLLYSLVKDVYDKHIRQQKVAALTETKTVDSLTIEEWCEQNRLYVERSIETTLHVYPDEDMATEKSKGLFGIDGQDSKSKVVEK